MIEQPLTRAHCARGGPARAEPHCHADKPATLHHSSSRCVRRGPGECRTVPPNLAEGPTKHAASLRPRPGRRAPQHRQAQPRHRHFRGWQHPVRPRDAAAARWAMVVSRFTSSATSADRRASPNVEETELLAFDCFWDGAHYHYGPRNKNHRIHWDWSVIRWSGCSPSWKTVTGGDDRARRLPWDRRRPGRGQGRVGASGDETTGFQDVRGRRAPDRS
jgi:hypothetical protein